MPPLVDGEVFLVDEAAAARPVLTALTPHLCRNEEAELQSLLVNNPALLPSRQIDPDNPPRWLLVQEEMPIPDPDNGVNRWSLDVLFVDHMAIPTFVECKRMRDTRARREVVAQMIEYAANGHHYWDATDLQARAMACAGSADALQAWVCEHTTMSDAQSFFKQVQANLREAKIRLIFFLEQAPSSLPSLVDFMNKQLNATEVLLVEAKQYRMAGSTPSGVWQDQRIIVPRVFGYSEQARVAKYESRQEVGNAMGASVKGEEAFMAILSHASLPVATQNAIQTLLNAWPHAPGDQTYWKFLRNANLVLPHLHPTRALLTIHNMGRSLWFNWGNWNPERYPECPPAMREGFARLLEQLQARCGWHFTEQQLQSTPSFKPGEWEEHVEQLIEVINGL